MNTNIQAEGADIAETWDKADAAIDKALTSMDEMFVQDIVKSGNTMETYKMILDSRINTCLEEARRQITQGEEYTGFLYIAELVNMYIKVRSYQDLEFGPREDYMEKVRNWNEQIHFWYKLQEIMGSIYDKQEKENGQ